MTACAPECHPCCCLVLDEPHPLGNHSCDDSKFVAKPRAQAGLRPWRWTEMAWGKMDARSYVSTHVGDLVHWNGFHNAHVSICPSVGRCSLRTGCHWICVQHFCGTSSFLIRNTQNALVEAI